MYEFKLTDRQAEKLSKWLKEIEPEFLEASGYFFPKETAMFGPYYGAIGGELSFTFTPTSLGTIVKVHKIAFDLSKSIDLTDYENW